jgi:hypothetical protein
MSEVHQLFPATDERADAIKEPAPGDKWRQGPYERTFMEVVTKYRQAAPDGQMRLVRWPSGPHGEGVECARYSTARSVSTMPMADWRAWCSRESTHLLKRGLTPKAESANRQRALARRHAVSELSGGHWAGSAEFRDGTRVEWSSAKSGDVLTVVATLAGVETKPFKAVVPRCHHPEPRHWPAAFWMWVGMRVAALQAPGVNAALERAEKHGWLVKMPGGDE